jgi:hypothetical protein
MFTHSHIHWCSLAVQACFVCSSTKNRAVHGIQVAMKQFIHLKKIPRISKFILLPS